MPESPFANRLLVVDDDPAFADLMRRIGEQLGFEIMLAEDGEGVATSVRSWRPSVIMLDLKMPRTDGIQLLRALAADKCAAHVVVTSGHDGKVLDAAVQLGRERGLKMSGVMQKPMRIEGIRDLLSGFKPVPRNLLSAELANAIASDELFLEYQPKLDYAAGRITGVEALVRWRHPTFGVVRPDQFIALAEESRLIHRLTDWVVAAATRQSAAWSAGNLALEMAVNISAKDIEDLDLPERLDQHCRDAGVDPASITLELTETGAMREAVQMMDVLTRLRLKGFKLSIDDFGTGYSSLVQLQRLPFSELKVDRSFVMQMLGNQGCRVICEIVIDLAGKLGLKSVAEGVEEGAALASLNNMGCNTAQGFYLSRPIAPDLIPDFVRGYDPGRAVSAA